MKKFTFLILVLLVNKNCFSQAFRINYMGLSNPVQTGNEAIAFPFYLGIGYEQNIGYRIAVSLEYNHSYPNVIKEILFDENFDELPYSKSFSGTNGNSFDYTYSLSYPMYEISYQSKYFFRDNSGPSMYVSTGISVLTINYTWEIESYDYYNSSNNTVEPPVDFRPGKFNEEVTSVPLALRFGYRDAIDGSFGDYSLGVKFNLSGDKNPANRTYKFVGESSLRDISFMISASWGVGWAKKNR